MFMFARLKLEAACSSVRVINFAEPSFFYPNCQNSISVEVIYCDAGVLKTVLSRHARLDCSFMLHTF